MSTSRSTSRRTSRRWQTPPTMVALQEILEEIPQGPRLRSPDSAWRRPRTRAFQELSNTCYPKVHRIWRDLRGSHCTTVTCRAPETDVTKEGCDSTSWSRDG